MADIEQVRRDVAAANRMPWGCLYMPIIGVTALYT